MSKLDKTPDLIKLYFVEESIKHQVKLGVVARAFNPSTREAEAGGFLSSRPAWSTK
jgi:major histocompatibility complex class I